MSTHIPTSVDSSRVFQCGNFDIFFKFTDEFWNGPVEEEEEETDDEPQFLVAIGNKSPTTEPCSKVIHIFFVTSSI